jgi:hypothetical protein
LTLLYRVLHLLAYQPVPVLLAVLLAALSVVLPVLLPVPPLPLLQLKRVEPWLLHAVSALFSASVQPAFLSNSIRSMKRRRTPGMHRVVQHTI